ncbi:hypothetical protein LCGC14_2184430 [marine sediment metagenome]|uniref:Nuclease associated modular domain-containing protein n=1 Tax=marine sediment metagenome TaxID=412755 RepID=A0A0F9GH46_9ZZZZ
MSVSKIKIYTFYNFLFWHYVVLGISSEKIGKLCKINGITIRRWLKIHNIKREKPLYMNKKWLIHNYTKLELSPKEIGKLCNVCNRIIHNWLRKFNIPKRSRSEASKIAQNRPGVNVKKIKIMKRVWNDLNYRAKMSGKNNPCWKEWEDLKCISKHYRMRRELGEMGIFAPEYCSYCNKLKSKKRKFDLMNLDHNYLENTLDYYYACHNCHNIYHTLAGLGGKTSGITIKPIPNLIKNLQKLKTREERKKLLKEVILKK